MFRRGRGVGRLVGVLRRDLANLLDGGGDLLGRRRLVVGRGVDTLDPVAGPFDRLADVDERVDSGLDGVGRRPEPSVRGRHPVGRGVRLLAHLADECLDVVGTVTRLLGELFDLVGDDREPVTVRVRPGGLDVGVQREHVRLLGDVTDHVRERLDLFDRLDEVGHLADRGVCRRLHLL